ncbi:unnamed protein product [Heligmosomoides polygyrus]|uniref:Reverse transcriptase domain-containing protein n=1 Tax=Heligmosomoides polygyrus TaxID=6339 RepID=A0A183FZW5_HELPZ|nr:unnamed protein product [Heligmosomoides polygyrus]
MSVPPRGATGNCSLFRAELNTDTRMQATAPSDSRRALAKPGECGKYARVPDARTALGAAELVRKSRNVSKTRVAMLNVAKKAAKKALAVARATHYGERFLYRLAKVHHRQTEDVEKFFGISDENGHLLMDRKMVLNRWRTYFEEVSTVEFAHSRIPYSPPVYDPVRKITVEEVEAALKKVKPGKATGPDDLATDLWKSNSWYPTKWLATFLNQVIA